jgi:hypothetical protein
LRPVIVTGKPLTRAAVKVILSAREIRTGRSIVYPVNRFTEEYVMRLIILICVWLAILIPFTIATQLGRSAANVFLEKIPDPSKLDDIASKPKNVVATGTDTIKNTADKLGLGKIADKVTGKVEEKTEDLAAKTTDATTGKLSGNVSRLKEFFSPSFPAFQINVLKLCPILSIIIIGSLLVLSIGFMWPRKPRADAEEG